MSSAVWFYPESPDDIRTPDPGAFAWFMSNGDQALRSPGMPATVAQRVYEMDEDRVITDVMHTIRFHRQSFVAGPGPFALAFPYSGELAFVFGDGIEQSLSDFGLTPGSTVFTVGGSVDTSVWQTIRVVFTRQ